MLFFLFLLNLCFLFLFFSCFFVFCSPFHNFFIFCIFEGGAGDRDSEDGRPLSLVNRRPSISAPISTRKPSSSSSRVHTPPLASPSFLSGDGASQSTPKRLTSEGNFNHNFSIYYMLQIVSLNQK